MLEKKLTEEILGVALSTGADFAEIYCELTRNGGIRLLDGSPTTRYRASGSAPSSERARSTARHPTSAERGFSAARHPLRRQWETEKRNAR